MAHGRLRMMKLQLPLEEVKSSSQGKKNVLCPKKPLRNPSAISLQSRSHVIKLESFQILTRSKSERASKMRCSIKTFTRRQAHASAPRSRTQGTACW